LGSQHNDLSTFKNSIKLEIESELNLIQDIQFINLKYKKLITEQRKEKEKLVQTVNGQKKIVDNYGKKKTMLEEDSSKLYDSFKATLTKDQRNSHHQKSVHHKSREDL
jgi:hypothetical protein